MAVYIIDGFGEFIKNSTLLRNQQ